MPPRGNAVLPGGARDGSRPFIPPQGWSPIDERCSLLGFVSSVACWGGRKNLFHVQLLYWCCHHGGGGGGSSRRDRRLYDSDLGAVEKQCLPSVCEDSARKTGQVVRSLS